MRSFARGSAHWGFIVGSLVLLAIAVPANATGPVTPLPRPSYSFDRDSPTVFGGYVGAADVLAYGFPHPLIEVHAEALGLTPADDIDGLSRGFLAGLPAEAVSMLFSVDRATVGTAPPDPTLVALGVPYNTLDQAQKRQAAGDQYMSLLLFTMSGRGMSRSANNTLVRNNFDEGGTSYTAQPPIPASGGNPARWLQDNVDSSAVLQRQAYPEGPILHVYFTLTADSPSLYSLPPHVPSGANIYYNAAPGQGASTTPYAIFQQLGLQQGDDVDALRVFDTNGTGQYDEGDQVLLSLTPDSPSIYGLPGRTGADVFRAVFGAPQIVPFTSGAELGIGSPVDNVDALDFFLCSDEIGCAADHGIRAPRPGDLNCDGRVDFDDISPFVLALSDPAAYQGEYPNCDIQNADCNLDGAVDFDDIDPFVGILSRPAWAGDRRDQGATRRAGPRSGPYALRADCAGAIRRRVSPVQTLDSLFICEICGQIRAGALLTARPPVWYCATERIRKCAGRVSLSGSPALSAAARAWQAGRQVSVRVLPRAGGCRRGEVARCRARGNVATCDRTYMAINTGGQK